MLKVYYHKYNQDVLFDDIIYSLNKCECFDLYDYVKERIQYVSKKLDEKGYKYTVYGDRCTFLIL